MVFNIFLHFYNEHRPFVIFYYKFIYKFFISTPEYQIFYDEKNVSLNIFIFFSCMTGKGLTQLDVSQNQLTKVPSTALKNLHHLLIFNVNHNRITQIHAKAFEGLDTLEILTMYENKINLVEPEAFRGLDK